MTHSQPDHPIVVEHPGSILFRDTAAFSIYY